jgi:hypothetical protein
VNDDTTARVALAMASAFDQTFAKPDPIIIAAWATVLGDMDPEAAKRAVEGHYTDEHRRIMPSDVVKRVRSERATVQQIHRHHNAVPNADPDDVKAWLAAVKRGDYIVEDTEPTKPRDIKGIIDAALDKGDDEAESA